MSATLHDGVVWMTLYSMVRLRKRKTRICLKTSRFKTEEVRFDSKSQSVFVVSARLGVNLLKLIPCTPHSQFSHFKDSSDFVWIRFCVIHVTWPRNLTCFCELELLVASKSLLRSDLRNNEPIHANRPGLSGIVLQISRFSLCPGRNEECPGNWRCICKDGWGTGNKESQVVKQVVARMEVLQIWEKVGDDLHLYTVIFVELSSQ